MLVLRQLVDCKGSVLPPEPFRPAWSQEAQWVQGFKPSGLKCS